MKLSRLQSIANNAVRGTIWSHTVEDNPAGFDPLGYHSPSFEIVVDLVKGTLTPDMEGDSVEKYYKTISRWFHEALVKEGIPIEAIMFAAPEANAPIFEPSPAAAVHVA